MSIGVRSTRHRALTTRTRGAAIHIRAPSIHIRAPSIHIRAPSIHILGPTDTTSAVTADRSGPPVQIRALTIGSRAGIFEYRPRTNAFSAPTTRIRTPITR